MDPDQDPKGKASSDPTSSGEGQGKEIVNPVPGAALEDERRKRQGLETEAAGLRGRLEGLSAALPPRDKGNGEQPQLTRPTLRKAVEDGTMTEDEANDAWEHQRDQAIDGRITKAVKSAVTDRDLAKRVSDEVGRYKTALPDITDRSSDSFATLQKEFRRLVELGYEAGDVRTELLAARAAFGSLERLEAAAGPHPRETFAETGGAGEAGETGKRVDGSPKGMTARERAHYDNLIKMGQYTGFDDPKIAAEIGQYADPGLRARHGAKVA